MVLLRSLKLVLIFGVKSILRVLRFLFPTKLQIEYINKVIPHLKTQIIPDLTQGSSETKRNQNLIRVVQISDIHYDEYPLRISDELLEKVVNQVNQFEPDLVVITGDLVQCNPEPIVKLLERHLSKLKAKNGVYAILGNHDYKTSHGADYIQNVLKNSSIRLLRNEIAYPFGREKGRLQLVGLGDIGRKKFDFNLDILREEIDSEPDRPRLILSHNPDSYSLFSEIEYDLILSGHTHGGQVCTPTGQPLIPILDKVVKLLPEWVLRNLHYPHGVVKDWSLASGRKTFADNANGGKREIYINRGLATHPPLRLFCDPEITVVNLISDENTQDN